MTHLSISLLSSFQVALDGIPVTKFGYDKVRALLAYLAIEAGQPHRREGLATLFWPDQPPKATRHSLSQALLKLRRAIRDQRASPPFLLSDRETVQFNTASNYQLDVETFTARLDACDAHPHLDVERCESCIQRLIEAIDLYRGEFLEGLLLGDSAAFEDWAIIHRERFHRRVLTALHKLTRHYARQGKYNQAKKYAWRQVELEPYREEAYRELMRLLARSGQRIAALAQYEICRRVLTEELGVEPAQETQALYERIRSAGEARPHNLPPLLTPLVGREGELQEIAERLANPDCRLLTLTGPGGIGKTHLALQAAAEHVGVFLHGVYFVPLAALSSPEFLVSTIAEAIGFRFSGPQEPKAQMLNYLREKEMLLVLDDFEHLLDGAHLVLDVLKGAPAVEILVTSRERLNLRSEWLLEVQGLPYPQEGAGEEIADYSAVQLFLQNAVRVRADFSLSYETIPPVARICQLVEGTPLGIELASAWVRVHSCEQILGEIEQNLDFLTSSMRDVPPQHRSLRAVFEHSWTLLSEAEQAVLRRLSVFRSPFRRAAARDVAGAIPHQLSTLVNKSLLHAGPTEQYDVHPLLKQYLVEKLAVDPNEEKRTRHAHARHYARFLQDREPALVIRNQAAALDEIGTEIDDLRAVWAWAVEQGAFDILDQSLDSLYIYFWARNQFREGKAALERAAEAITACCTPAQGKLLLSRIWARLAEFHAWLGDMEEAHRLLLESVNDLRRLHNDEELAFALDVLGRLHFWQGNYAQSKGALREALAFARKSGAEHHLAQSLTSLAIVICEESADYEAAQRLSEESLTLYKELDNPFGVAKVLINRGANFYEQSDYPQAQHLYEQSLKIYRQLNYSYGVSAALNNLAIVARQLGDLATAKELVEESLALKRETGNRNAILHSLLEIGTLGTTMGTYAEARGHFREALQLAQESQATGFTFNLLLGFAELYAKMGEMERAADLVAFVRSQEGLGQEAKNQARDLWAELPSEMLAAARERGQGKRLEEVVEEVLTSHFHPP